MSSIIFILDIIFSIISDIVGFFETSQGSAIAIIVFFSAAGCLVIPLSAIVLRYINKSTAGVLAWALQIVLAFAYYYGKNINGILIRYGTFLGCEESCQRTNQFVALFSLLLAILFLTYVIPVLHTLIQKNSKKTYHEYERYFFGVISVYVNANAIFATLSLIPADIQCTLYVVILSSVYLSIITAVAIIKIYADYKLEYYSNKDDNDDEEFGFFNCLSCGTVLATIFGYYALLFIVPVYLLGNNQLPLEYISCNSTGGAVMDTGKNTDHAIRLACMIVTGVAVLLALYLFWKNRGNRKTETLHM